MKVKLDTNGTDPDMLRDLIDAGLVDYVAMDLKAPLNEKYDDLAGVSVDLDRIKRSIELLETSGVEHEFRTTVVPILLTAQDIEAWPRTSVGTEEVGAAAVPAGAHPGPEPLGRSSPTPRARSWAWPRTPSSMSARWSSAATSSAGRIINCRS